MAKNNAFLSFGNGAFIAGLRIISIKVNVAHAIVLAEALTNNKIIVVYFIRRTEPMKYLKIKSVSDIRKFNFVQNIIHLRSFNRKCVSYVQERHVNLTSALLLYFL